MSVVAEVSTLEAYERWAPTYPPLAHNPLMRAEQGAMLDLLPSIAGRRVLDLACGSGRYTQILLERGASDAVALDFSPSMLGRVADGIRVCADMSLLPFASESFACVVSGLAVGHVDDLPSWYGEVARVLAPKGVLLFSDFHPTAATAGLSRSFKDEAQKTWRVPHRLYGEEDHRRAATAAGLVIEVMKILRVGMEFVERFPKCDEFYAQRRGLPIVLLVRAVKT